MYNENKVSTLILSVLWIFQRFQPSKCNTVRFNTQECAGQPEEPMSFAGAVVYNGVTLGRTTCYFGPNDPVQYMAIKIDKMELPKSLVKSYISCLMFRVEANCSNYEKIQQMALKTSSPGLRLQMMFDPFNAAVNDLSYEFTLTSFVIGPSFNCPSGTFRCWTDRSRCIPEALTCDGVDNCSDNSDENNYLCKSPDRLLFAYHILRNSEMFFPYSSFIAHKILDG
ncbi:hypothetical protein FBUS_03134 [Fasciolopsis buskii]|uniref:Uncharacterized protein n=1 Tax=Fasciolopsis buskii TaxID=27845 RepID=A0A8E0S497_9TREM|nr:hypothetical protein FBUS_03134 [Fasciolopsis buski]